MRTSGSNLGKVMVNKMKTSISGAINVTESGKQEEETSVEIAMLGMHVKKTAKNAVYVTKIRYFPQQILSTTKI